MSDKVTVVFVKDTGHVLAAVTRNADEDVMVPLEQLVSSTLFIRGLDNAALGNPTGLTFDIPVGELDTTTLQITGMEGVLRTPRTFFVDQTDPKNPKLANLPLDSATSPPLMVKDVELENGSITVILQFPESTTGVTEATAVWVLIVKPGSSVIGKGTIQVGDDRVQIQLGTTFGTDHDVLVYVSKLRSYAKNITVS